MPSEQVNKGKIKRSRSYQERDSVPKREQDLESPLDRSDVLRARPLLRLIYPFWDHVRGVPRVCC